MSEIRIGCSFTAHFRYEQFKIPITLSHVRKKRAKPLRLWALVNWGSCHKRQKPQAHTPQAPIRNRQTRKVANAKGLNRNTNLT